MLWILIILPFFASLILPFAGKILKHRVGVLALAVAFVCALIAGFEFLLASPHNPAPERWDWIPQLGVSLSLATTGVNHFFGIVVAGMGLLVVWYAVFYLDKSYKHQGRFYAYLMAFMGAMLGTVYADNLLLLFLFWELTGITSFFLIGFLHNKEESRLGARMALVTTGLTGLLMLVGIVPLYLATGTLEISELIYKVGDAEFLASINFAAAFFLLAAFGKSAQFPFHFWLPKAMAAPTPVSAYLHSAAMVKLGIFLCARLFPILSAASYFHELLLVVGFLTMFIGAAFALLSHDLKAILAFSTVSQLGFLMGAYGLSFQGAQYDTFHILNHVFYKGSLFMVVGIVDHTVHNRDIRKLGGLFRTMPLTAIACLIGVMAMAGIPLTTGFISKELLLVQAMQLASEQGGLFWLVPGAIIASAVCLVAFSIRLFWHTFVRPSEFVSQANIHKPGLGIQLSPFFLAFCALFFGVFPGGLEWFSQAVSTSGLTADHLPHLALWHGFTTELFISLGIVVAGFALYKFFNAKNFELGGIPQVLRFDEHFNRGYDAFVNSCARLQKALLAESERDYLAVTLSAIVSILVFVVWPLMSQLALPDVSNLHITEVLALVVLVLIVMATVACVRLERWLGKIIALSLVGFLVTFYFVLYRAPDLALTQILVETASLIILIILFYRFDLRDEQRYLSAKLDAGRKLWAYGISVAAAAVVFVVTFVVAQNPPSERLGDDFLKLTVPLAEGHNTVNTILVDFRGYDTMGEITVLMIALLGALGLLGFKMKGRAS